MFRKNNIERSHSAGTRMVASKKLPSDFFTPSKSNAKREKTEESPCKVREVKSIEKFRSKDELLFTFNQSTCLKNYGVVESGSKIKRMNSSKLIKLPPVLLRINKENFRQENGEGRLMKVNRQPTWGKCWGREELLQVS